jgi:uncharacterized protein (TIRG00374 family)
MNDLTSRRGRRFWLGMFVSALSLAAILLLINPIEVYNALRTVRPGYLLISITGILLFLVIRAHRWRFLLGDEIGFVHAFHVQNIGYLVSTVFPFRMGDIARAVLIGNVPPVSVARGMSTVVVERLLDLLFVVLLLPLTLTSIQHIPNWMRTAFVLSAALVVLALAILITVANSRALIARLALPLIGLLPESSRATWSRRVDELLAGLGGLTSGVAALKLMVYTALLWLPIIGGYYAGLRAVGLHPTWLMTGFVFCAAAFSVAAPSSPAQFGVFHAGVIAALQLLGQPETESAAFAFLYHGLNVTAMIVFGRIGLAKSQVTLTQLMVATRRVIQRDS